MTDGTRQRDHLGLRRIAIDVVLDTAPAVGKTPRFGVVEQTPHDVGFGIAGVERAADVEMLAAGREQVDRDQTLTRTAPLRM